MRSETRQERGGEQIPQGDQVLIRIFTLRESKALEDFEQTSDMIHFLAVTLGLLC